MKRSLWLRTPSYFHIASLLYFKSIHSSHLPSCCFPLSWKQRLLGNSRVRSLDGSSSHSWNSHRNCLRRCRFGLCITLSSSLSHIVFTLSFVSRLFLSLRPNVSASSLVSLSRSASNSDCHTDVSAVSCSRVCLMFSAPRNTLSSLSLNTL